MPHSIPSGYRLSGTPARQTTQSRPSNGSPRVWTVGLSFGQNDTLPMNELPICLVGP